MPKPELDKTEFHSNLQVLEIDQEHIHIHNSPAHNKQNNDSFLLLFGFSLCNKAGRPDFLATFVFHPKLL